MGLKKQELENAPKRRRVADHSCSDVGHFVDQNESEGLHVMKPGEAPPGAETDGKDRPLADGERGVAGVAGVAFHVRVVMSQQVGDQSGPKGGGVAVSCSQPAQKTGGAGVEHRQKVGGPFSAGGPKDPVALAVDPRFFTTGRPEIEFFRRPPADNKAAAAAAPLTAPSAREKGAFIIGAWRTCSVSPPAKRVNGGGSTAASRTWATAGRPPNGSLGYAAFRFL